MHVMYTCSLQMSKLGNVVHVKYHSKDTRSSCHCLSVCAIQPYNSNEWNLYEIQIKSKPSKPFAFDELGCGCADWKDIAGFTWDEYLTTTRSQPVPSRAFKPV